MSCSLALVVGGYWKRLHVAVSSPRVMCSLLLSYSAAISPDGSKASERNVVSDMAYCLYIDHLVVSYMTRRFSDQVPVRT